ncbi:uncharacterized protein GGS22DRAFT_70949 [Annulohypoxylon maeteangense]|uniref:uncharacterized protein n=1 Tax=Annulohypoxylon maeteangense TaxID=1927788 RepID=UPI002007C6E7|nr:uncharacterized protein GGS22DRAFT_70949 [Annulohypoxylon maeteangense]KAI0889422.1 hypothetical protein GGS22DRAFT_70949 [Annulohypoxylon maeteangense]
MSFGVAVQSAIFYLVSCAPCLQAKHHQQSKAKAKKEREEKARIQAENPGSYLHPDPFNTNPYWSEEIMMGPRIQSKKYNGGVSKDINQKRLNSSGKESTSVAGSSTQVNSMSPGSSRTAVEDGKLSFSTSYSDDWNRKRYQREDEELWGQGHDLSRTHKLMDALKQAGSSAGRLFDASLGKEKEPKLVTDEDRHNFYFAPRNPPVNDYHPPIVRQKPTHKDGNRWMLQPPPPAKIMEGKVPVSRSGSMASHISRKTTMSDGSNLGRLVHERAMEAKFKSGELPSDFESTTTLHKTITRKNTASSRGQQSHRVPRSRSVSLESSDASDEPRRRKSRRARQPVPADFDSSSEEEYYLRSSDSFGRGRRAARQPKLQPISSSQENEKDSKESVSLEGKGDALTRSASFALANATSNSSPSRLNPATPSRKPVEEVRQKSSPVALGAPLKASS